jgi:hypothetical protein
MSRRSQSSGLSGSAPPCGRLAHALGGTAGWCAEENRPLGGGHGRQRHYRLPRVTASLDAGIEVEIATPNLGPEGTGPGHPPTGWPLAPER